jgi:hypothetical protein
MATLTYNFYTSASILFYFWAYYFSDYYPVGSTSKSHSHHPVELGDAATTGPVD